VGDLTDRSRSGVLTVQILGHRRWCVFGMKNLSCTLPLNLVRRASSLNHRHESSRWRECLFFGSWLPWLAMLDCSILVALLHHVRWRIRWRRWNIVSYCAGHQLLGLHSFLKCSTETKEFPALDEEMRRSSDAVFIEVRVPCAPSIEYFFR
jgi:hypothetical protein